MAAPSQSPALSPRLRFSLHLLLAITVLNYVAQIPYYIHFYAVHQVAPTPFAVGFLVVTLALFLAGYVLVLQSKPVGGWLLLAFLLLEFGGYLLHNLTGAFLQDLPANDLLFFTVSLIGYLNFAVSLVYLIVLAVNRRVFFPQRQPSASALPISGVPEDDKTPSH
ncbi:MAG TPA: hypothetical protein VKT82_34670 [Ktedonobacterales bacterium]|nr:hypothetical protein [Ktedonobacterales bacterium]